MAIFSDLTADDGDSCRCNAYNININNNNDDSSNGKFGWVQGPFQSLKAEIELASFVNIPEWKN